MSLLALAQTKAVLTGAPLGLSAGMTTQLPYRQSVYDCVLASLVFNQLNPADRSNALREVLRVLSPGGKLCIVDFGQPLGLLAFLISLMVRHLEETADIIKGALPSMLQQTGFTNVQTQTHLLTIVGTLTLYVAEKPTE